MGYLAINGHVKKDAPQYAFFGTKEYLIADKGRYNWEFKIETFDIDYNGFKGKAHAIVHPKQFNDESDSVLMTEGWSHLDLNYVDVKFYTRDSYQVRQFPQLSYLMFEQS